MDLQAVRAVATEIALRAGAVLMNYYDRPHQESTKKNAFDIVTEGDRDSEAVIVAALREAFPEHHIVGEEGGGMGAPAETAENFWYIDPVDGTSNFANDIPFFSVSMALADRARNPLVGVVLNPVHDELYSAALGHGATLNGVPLHVTDTATLLDSIVVSGFPYDKATDPNNNFKQWADFTVRTRGTRRFGSVALELGYLAKGRFDGLWELKLNPWDVLAGILIVREAGGLVTDYSGGTSAKLYAGTEIVASNGLIHEEMLQVLRESERSS